MRLASVHSADEERFIVTGIRQSSDYSAGSVYWLGARVEGSWDNFSWSDGTAAQYKSWLYNDTTEVEDSCLGVQWKSSPVPSQPSGLYWTLHKCSATGGYVCKRRLSSEIIVRNRTVEGSSGELSSPEHPNMYDNDLDYWVHVVGPPETRLVFVFQRIELEFQKDCLYDFVELRDALNLKSSRYCGSVGRRVFLNISFFDFGSGTFENGVPSNLTETLAEDSFLEIQVDLEDQPIKPFLEPDVLTNGFYVSTAEIMRLRFRTGSNVTGKGFQAYFKTVKKHKQS
ncbi:hypothetical protein MSG28_004932 [Choristoneura fumiferana]|uniref:Uncharacterized protein n=1 Tax=Choristoneura fumiferana TaxID=7141 RepID=A0ACC0JP97_CHOFU|nr:hypothetical protein MSG28_004932 [Choristoneura fumiferana]